MIVGTARIVLAIPGNDSLKGKRKVARRILDRLRHRFNAAAAEVDDLDAHRRLVIGLAVVSNEAGHASSMLDSLRDYIAGASEAVIMDVRTELVHLGHGEHMGSWDDDETGR